jgi:hypothetical protein
MKHRVISTSDAPVHLPFSRGSIVLKKRGDTGEADVSAVAAQNIAKHGMVRFERIIEAPKPVEKATLRPRAAVAAPAAAPVTEPPPATTAPAEPTKSE